MTRLFRTMLACALLAALGLAREEFGLRSVPATSVQLESDAWRGRIELVQATLLPDLFARFEREGHLANFDIAAGSAGAHNEDPEADAEVYRWIVAAASTLHTVPNEELRARVDGVIARIVAAQEKDGYLVTWIQVTRPKRRFRELRDSFELYSIGHLLRAGLAWREATGDASLHDAGLRSAKLVAGRFGPGKLLDPPGFPAIEGALIDLADDTGDESWADLALFFIEQRGDEKRRKRYGIEFQDADPVLVETQAIGHVERGLALYAAITKVARTRGYQEYWNSAQAVWNDIVRRKMYVTGGVGSLASRESFGERFELPLETAYCTTSAAASMVELNQSLLLRMGHAVGADMVELELYNALLAGMSVDGKHFFHDSPLVSAGGAQRSDSLETTRGISALAETVADVGGLIYAHTEKDLYLGQYIGSSATIPLNGTDVRVKLETDYPESGHVQLTFDPPRIVTFTLHVRVPGWCTEAVTLGANDVLQVIKVNHGHDRGTWLKFEREWKPGDTFTIQFPMTAQAIEPRRKIEAEEGRIALRRGPEIYCVEAVDNGGAVFDAFVPRSAQLSTRFDAELLGGVHVIEALGGRLALGEKGPSLRPATVVAVPYRLWGNRGLGAMSVWLGTSPKFAELPGEHGAVYENGLLVHASHVNRHTSLRAVCDGVLPRDSRDELVARATFADHKGSEEWVRYDFDAPRLIEGASVYWFDQGEGGTCRLPKSWRVQWLQGETWTDVKLKSSFYPVTPDQENVVEFAKVATASIRILVQLQPGASAGVLEWSVREAN